MRSQFHYISAGSVKEALEFLSVHGAETSVLAGGTDLMIAARNGQMQSRYVLDVSGIEEMRRVQEVDGFLEIGAAVTFSEIIGLDLVQASAPVLAAACARIGSVQIRNVGTLGGNVANASPAADGVPPLVVHNTRALVQTSESDRLVPIPALILGPYRTDLKAGELITKFLLEPLKGTYRYNFQRVARRREMAIARINLAAVALVEEDRRISDVRLSAGSVTPSPCRMRAAEEILEGNVPNTELIRKAAGKVSEEMIRQSGIRISTEYKKPAVEGMVIKALSEMFSERP